MVLWRRMTLAAIIVLACSITIGCSRELLLKVRGWKHLGTVNDAKMQINPDEYEAIRKENFNKYLVQLKSNPDDYMLNYLVAMSICDPCKDSAALKYLIHSLELKPNNVMVLTAISDLYSRCETTLLNRETVLEYLSKATKLEMESGDTQSVKAQMLNSIGVIYEKIGANDESCGCFKSASKMQPDDVFIVENKRYTIIKGLSNRYRKDVNRVCGGK